MYITTKNYVKLLKHPVSLIFVKNNALNSYVAHVTRLDIMILSKNNFFSLLTIKNIPVTDGQKLKKNWACQQCKYRKWCKTKKSSCLYYTNCKNRDTLRTQSVQESFNDDDDSQWKFWGKSILPFVGPFLPKNDCKSTCYACFDLIMNENLFWSPAGGGWDL